MNDTEEKMSKKIQDYRDLAKQDKNIDVAALALNALQADLQPESVKSARWAYVISLGLPPLGLLVAVKYFLDGTDRAKSIAWTCVVLTFVSITLTILTFNFMLSGSNVSVDQIKQINPQDLQELLQ